MADREALGVLEDLEETEEGFLYERADGELELEPEDFRRTGHSAVSAMTLKDEPAGDSDIPLLRGSRLDWGFRQISNLVRVQVETLSESNEITLWTSAQEVVVPAGGLRILIINYPTDNSPANHRGAASWIAPIGGHGLHNGSRTGSRRRSGDGALYVITMTNSSSNNVTFAAGALQVRGKALVAGAPIYVESKDTTSIDTFGEREYPRPSPLFTDIGEAQEYADGLVNANKSPNGWLVTRWPAYKAAGQARTLELSRRITVLRDNEQLDYYIEGVGIALIGYVRLWSICCPRYRALDPVLMRRFVTLSDIVASKTTTWPFRGPNRSMAAQRLADYDVQYREVGTQVRHGLTQPHTGTSRTASSIIRDWKREALSYEVQVRADERPGRSGRGANSAISAEHAQTYSS